MCPFFSPLVIWQRCQDTSGQSGFHVYNIYLPQSEQRTLGSQSSLWVFTWWLYFMLKIIRIIYVCSELVPEGNISCDTCSPQSRCSHVSAPSVLMCKVNKVWAAGVGFTLQDCSCFKPQSKHFLVWVVGDCLFFITDPVAGSYTMLGCRPFWVSERKCQRINNLQGVRIFLAEHSDHRELFSRVHHRVFFLSSLSLRLLSGAGKLPTFLYKQTSFPQHCSSNTADVFQSVVDLMLDEVKDKSVLFFTFVPFTLLIFSFWDDKPYWGETMCLEFKLNLTPVFGTWHNKLTSNNNLYITSSVRSCPTKRAADSQLSDMYICSSPKVTFSSFWPTEHLDKDKPDKLKSSSLTTESSVIWVQANQTTVNVCTTHVTVRGSKFFTTARDACQTWFTCGNNNNIICAAVERCRLWFVSSKRATNVKRPVSPRGVFNGWHRTMTTARGGYGSVSRPLMEGGWFWQRSQSLGGTKVVQIWVGLFLNQSQEMEPQ